MFLKLVNMLEEIKKLRNKKLDLEVRLLGWLKGPKKVLDDSRSYRRRSPPISQKSSYFGK